MGIKETRSYDERQRLYALGAAKGDGEIVRALRLTLDAASRITTITDLRPGVGPDEDLTATYTYDDRYRLRAGGKPSVGGKVPCSFVAGTTVDTDSGPVPIETLRVGDRVRGLDPSCAADHMDDEWRVATLRVRTAEASEAEVKLARPLAWLRDHGFVVAGAPWLELAEIGIAGPAEVLSVDPVPPEAAGLGCLVTMTVTRVAPSLARVTLSRGAELLTTPEHLLFSQERGWTAAHALTPGERVQTEQGFVDVQSVDVSLPSERVYNLEVARDHAYFVGEDGVWAHNACPRPAPRAAPTERAAREVGRNANGQAINSRGEVLGPSGKPLHHHVEHKSAHQAHRAAQDRSAKGAQAIDHPDPSKGNSHSHAAKKQGGQDLKKNDQTHEDY